jgi:hypothetical protein
MECKICNNDLEIKEEIMPVGGPIYNLQGMVSKYEFHYCKSCGLMYFIPSHNSECTVRSKAPHQNQ